MLQMKAIRGCLSEPLTHIVWCYPYSVAIIASWCPSQNNGYELVYIGTVAPSIVKQLLHNEAQRRQHRLHLSMSLQAVTLHQPLQGEIRKLPKTIGQLFLKSHPCLHFSPDLLCKTLRKYINKVRFIILLSVRTSAATRVNKARQTAFYHSAWVIQNTPPIPEALIQHIQRAIYQTFYVWGQTLVAQQHLAHPVTGADRGWGPKGTSTQSRLWVQEDLNGLCRCIWSNHTCTILCACAGHYSRQGR